MNTEAPQNNIYVVLSQTGTILSRLLKIVTGKQFNHASLSLVGDLSTMYSFGRKSAYNPFRGGFVQESADFGTFKRFKDTEVIVLSIPMDNEKYFELGIRLNEMFENKAKYKYSCLGVFLAAFNIPLRRDYCYYCSEFVRDMLILHNVEGSELLNEIVHPMNFLAIPHTRVIYQGKLRDYSMSDECKQELMNRLLSGSRC